MKKAILFFTCLLLISKTYCQVLSDSTSKGNFTKANYLQKSKNQKTGAWVLVSAGVVIFAVTGITASNNLDFGATHTKHKYGVPIGLSIACIAGSIPLFIAAGRNKSKATHAAAHFKIENIPILQQTGINFHSYPAISIKLCL
jgi:hypothetical protein